jgi:hypothetical protein
MPWQPLSYAYAAALSSALASGGYGLIARTHRAIRKYCEQVGALRGQRVLNEMNVRSAFEFLLADAGLLRKLVFAFHLPS